MSGMTKAMESSASQRYRIAIIVTWFGKLPEYFPLWLRSAACNPSVDFLMFSDCEVMNPPANLKVFSTTLQDEIERYRFVLQRDIEITDSYKYCDCRPYFGRLYAAYLDGYDFWGYCDIDLVFGDIRAFVTDEVLDTHDRIYQYGHLCLFRNCERVNHLMDLPGSLYTEDEIFLGKVKVTPEEYGGLNRICQRNGISWYTTLDFADFYISLPGRLELDHGLKNYPEQIFYWEDGRAYRAYADGGEVHREEYVYIHWQKRKPSLMCLEEPIESCFILPNELRQKKRGLPSIEEMRALNPPISQREIKRLVARRRRALFLRIMRSNKEQRSVFFRQLRSRIFDKRDYR